MERKVGHNYLDKQINKCDMITNLLGSSIDKKAS